MCLELNSKGQILPVHLLLRKVPDIPIGIYREPPKIKRKDLVEIDHMILRVQMASRKPLDDSVILELAEQYLFKDIQLACSFLLSLQEVFFLTGVLNLKPAIAATLFDKYIEAAQPTQSEQFINFACYFFALVALKSVVNEAELKGVLSSTQESILEAVEKRLEKEELKNANTAVLALMNKYKLLQKEIGETKART